MYLGCPWCDGWEHKDEPFANLGIFGAALIKSTVRMTTLNPSPLMLTNGTCDDAARAQASADLPSWEQQLQYYDIGIEDRVISAFSRVHGNDSNYDDDFWITFADNSSIMRHSIKANFAATLASDLPEALGLSTAVDESEGTLNVVVDENKETSMPGVFMVGDANS